VNNILLLLVFLFNKLQLPTNIELNPSYILIKMIFFLKLNLLVLLA